MDNKLSLKAQLQAMNTGDVMITDHQRTGVYVAAKRAGLKVSTKDLPDGQIEVTALAKIVNTPKAKISEYDATLERVKGWTIETRKRLFDAFELCCGMNRGDCICPTEEIEIAPVEPVSKLDYLRALIEPIERGETIAPAIEIEPQWIEMPQTRENGEILSWRRKAKGQPQCYKRETDWDTFA